MQRLGTHGISFFTLLVLLVVIGTWHYRNADVALIKRVYFGETRNLELRLEAFNLTNTPPLGAPNAVLASPGFGSIISAGDPRVLQLGVKFNF